jgi:hypothetical protein
LLTVPEPSAGKRYSGCPYASTMTFWFMFVNVFFTDMTVSAGADVSCTGPASADCGPMPAALRAATRKEYDFASVRPVTTAVVAVELKVRGACATAPTKGVTM